MVMLMDKVVDGKQESVNLSKRAKRRFFVGIMAVYTFMAAFFGIMIWVARDIPLAVFYLIIGFLSLAIGFGGLLVSVAPVYYLYNIFIPQLQKNAGEIKEFILVLKNKQASKTILLFGVFLPPVGILMQIVALLLSVIYFSGSLVAIFYIIASTCYISGKPIESLVYQFENESLSEFGEDNEETLETHGSFS